MSQQRVRSSARFVPAAILTAVWAGAFTGAVASADTFTWNGNTGSFSDAAQWAGGAAPTGLNPADAFTFGGAAGYTATSNIAPLGGTLPAFYYGSIAIANGGGFAGIVAGAPTQLRTLTGATVNYTGASDFMVAPVFSIARGATLSVNVAAGSGTLSLADRTTPTALKAHSFSGEGNVVINNLSSNPVYAGNLGILEGNLTVTAGVVRAADGDGVSTLDGGVATKGGDTISNLTLITVAAGAEYDLNANSEAMGGISGAGTIRLGATGGMTLNYSSDLTFDGQIVSSGTGGVSKGQNSGNGTTYTFRGDSTYIAGTSVAAGTLKLSGGGKLSGTATVSVSSGANLVLDNTGQNVADRINPSAVVTLGGDLTLLGAPGQASTQAINTLTVLTTPGGTGNVNVVNGASGGTATLTINTLDRGTARAAHVNFTGDGSVIINSPSLTNGIIGGWATVNGADFATVDGSNKVVPLASHQTSADTSTWGAADNVKVTGPLTGNADAASSSVNSLVLASTDHVAVGTTLAINSGGIIATETTAIDGPGSIYGNMPAATSSDLIFTVAGSKTLTINAPIAGSAAAGGVSNGLVKAGDGALVLAATNTYDADTRVTGGTLSIPSDAALGSGSAIRISNGATLKITGTGFTSSKVLRFEGSGGTLDTGANDASFTGNVVNNGKLTKIGTGTLIVKLPNAGGDIDILQGGIRTGAGDTLDNATLVTIAAGAFLDLSLDTSGEDFGAVAGAGELRVRTAGTAGWAGGSWSNITFSGNIIPYSGGAPSATGGNIAKTGLGTLTLSGASTFTGTTRVSTGTLVAGANVLPNVAGPFGNASSAIQVGLTPTTTTGAGDLLCAASLMIGQPNVTIGRDVAVLNPVGGGQTFTGAISIGASHASGASTYSGAITLNRGIELSVPSAAATTSLTGVITGSGGLVKVGAGTAVLSGANTHTGGTAVLAGTLTVAHPAALGTGPVAVNGGTLVAAPGLAGPLAPSSLSLANAGTLDLNDNDMILDYAATSPLAAVKAAIAAARNGGAWNQPGITSTSAKTIAGGTTTLAAVEASDLGATTFDGATVDATAVLVKYTYYGDLNLDGKINGDDYALIDRGRAKGLSGWVNGDVDYSGTINAADYLLMDNAFGHQTGALSPEFLAMRESQFGDAYVAQLVAAVPEPTSLSLLGFAALPLLARRRRQA